MKTSARRNVFLQSALAIVFAASLALSFPPPSTAAEAKSPEAVLLELLELFRDVERACEEGRWQEAKQLCSRLSRSFYELVPEPATEARKEFYFRFGKVMAGFETGLEQRDAGEVEKCSVPLHQIFFAVMNDYDYPVPPALAFVRKDLGKAIEALGKGDMAEVDHELYEVESFYPRARVALVRKNVPDGRLGRCDTLLLEARSCLEGGDLETLGRRLGDLQEEMDAIAVLIRP